MAGDGKKSLARERLAGVHNPCAMSEGPGPYRNRTHLPRQTVVVIIYKGVTPETTKHSEKHKRRDSTSIKPLSQEHDQEHAIQRRIEGLNGKGVSWHYNETGR